MRRKENWGYTSDQMEAELNVLLSDLHSLQDSLRDPAHHALLDKVMVISA